MFGEADERNALQGEAEGVRRSREELLRAQEGLAGFSPPSLAEGRLRRSNHPFCMRRDGDLLRLRSLS